MSMVALALTVLLAATAAFYIAASMAAARPGRGMSAPVARSLSQSGLDRIATAGMGVST